MEEEKSQETGEKLPGWDHVQGKDPSPPPGKLLGPGESFGADLKAVENPLAPQPRFGDLFTAKEELEAIAIRLRGGGERGATRNVSLAISRIEDAVDKLDRALRGE